MPTITLNKKRVLKLADIDLSEEELKESISYLGTDLEEITDEEIIVEIFPNRPDLLSEEGFARALSSFTQKKLGLRKYEAKTSNYKVKIEKEVKEVRPFTACAVIKNMKFTEEVLNDIIEIQEKLHMTYGRNRKKCAIGIYPMEAIKFPITYTAKKPNEIKFIPLEKTTEMTGLQILQKHEKGKEYAHLLEGKSVYPIFIDANKQILSMPPIINSEKTGKVGDKTTEVFVECSGFEFHTVSKALNMLVCAMADTGGEIYSCKLEYEGENERITPELTPEEIIVETYYIHKYIGIKLTDKQILNSIEKMGMSANIEKNRLTVKIPGYRADIIHPIDIVEDIAIGYGFYNVKEDTNRKYSTAKELHEEKTKRKLREILISLGLIETVSYSLTSKKIQEKIFDEKSITNISNTVSSEYNSLRRSLLLTLLKTLKANKHHEYPQNIFEIGTVFNENDLESTGVEEKQNLAVTICSESADFTTIKQILDQIMKSVDIKYETKRASNDFFLEGRCASININEEIIGYIGEVHPKNLELFEIEMPIAAFELNIDKLEKEIVNLNQ